MMDDQKVEVKDEGGKPVKSVPVEKFFQDLAQALQTHEQKARRLITKLQDPANGKPSKQALANVFASLFDLIMTTSKVERVTIGHAQAMARTFSTQVRVLIRVLKNKGLFTEEELKKATEDLIKEDEEANKKRLENQQDESLSESLVAAKEEAEKRQKQPEAEQVVKKIETE
jgi:DNA-binding helix-hairpin-helix protein with protein kinase domain